MRLNTIIVLVTSLLIGLSRCTLSTDFSLSDGIAPGGKQIFVTTPSNFPGGNLGGPTGADTFCQNSNEKPSRGTYKALLASATRRACSTSNCSTANEGLDWVLTANTKYVQKNSIHEIFTTNSNGIFVFGTMANPFIVTSAALYFTGLTTTWQTSANTCSNWTSSSGSVNSQLGTPSSQSSDAISFSTSICNLTQTLVCVEQ
jgi:Protein of unknown function (DUF1554)